mgnify:CR=1 FL=1
MNKLPSMDLDFSKSATVWKFLHDKSFVRGLMGPVGSGKSYGCAAEIMLKAVQQKPSPRDGIRVIPRGCMGSNALATPDYSPFKAADTRWCAWN